MSIDGYGNSILNSKTLVKLTTQEQSFCNQIISDANPIDPVSLVYQRIENDLSNIKGLTLNSIERITQEITPKFDDEVVKKIKNTLLDKFLSLTKPDFENLKQAAIYAHLLADKDPIKIIKDFSKLKLQLIPVEDRVVLAKIIAKQGYHPCTELVKNFDMFNLQESATKDRIEIAMLITNHGYSLVQLLCENLDKFQLLSADIRDRIELFKSISKSGLLNKSLFAKVFDMLQLQTADITDRLKLARFCSTHCLEEPFIKNFEKFRLENVASADLIAIAITILRRGYGVTLVENLEMFGIQTASIKDRLSLAKIFAKIGSTVSLQSLASHFNKFKLEQVDPRIRLKFAIRIAKGGIHAASTLAYNFEKFGLEKTDLEDRIELVKLIINQGEDAASAVAENFNKFNLADLKFNQLKQLTGLLVTATTNYNKVFDTIKDKVINRRLYIEILTDPNCFRSDTFVQMVKKAGENNLISNLFVYERKYVEMIINSGEIPNELNQQFIKLRKLILESNLDTLLSQFDHFANLKNPMLQFSLMKWLAYSTGLIRNMTDELTKTIDSIFPHSVVKWVSDTTGFLTKERAETVEASVPLIYSHQVPNQRFALVSELCNVVMLNSDFHLNEPVSNRNWGKLSWILLSRLQLLGMDRDAALKIHSLIDTTSKFKDTNRFKILINLLLNLISLEPINQAEMKLVTNTLEHALHSKKSIISKKGKERLVGRNIKEITSALQNLNNIIHLFGREAFFECLSNSENPERYFINKIKEFFNIEDISNFGEKFTDTFGKFRDTKALFTYLGSMEQLPEDEKERVKDALEIFFNRVIMGSFRRKRYFTNDQPHLNKVFGFREDLKELWLKSPTILATGVYSISESDDPCDLLLIGTEIQGSCQSVNGESRLNKCLVSYLLHGEIRPIVIKDANGKLVARSLLRLLWDNKNQTPVLLQERLYSNVESQSVKDAINAWAVKKAKKMGIPLVSKAIGTGAPYTGNVQFFGGIAPFVYSDAGGGVLDGKREFSVNGCHVLYDGR